MKKPFRIDKEMTLERWEKIYAESVLRLEDEGVIIQEVISHGKGGKALKIHPAYTIFKESSKQLGIFNKWHEGSAQMELDLS